MVGRLGGFADVVRLDYSTDARALFAACEEDRRGEARSRARIT